MMMRWVWHESVMEKRNAVVHRRIICKWILKDDIVRMLSRF